MDYSESISVSVSKGSVMEEQEGSTQGKLVPPGEEEDVIWNEHIQQNDILLGIYKVVSDPIKGGIG